jgi:hypothetical protein
MICGRAVCTLPDDRRCVGAPEVNWKLARTCSRIEKGAAGSVFWVHSDETKRVQRGPKSVPEATRPSLRIPKNAEKVQREARS